MTQQPTRRQETSLSSNNDFLVSVNHIIYLPPPCWLVTELEMSLASVVQAGEALWSGCCFLNWSRHSWASSSRPSWCKQRANLKKKWESHCKLQSACIQTCVTYNSKCHKCNYCCSLRGRSRKGGVQRVRTNPLFSCTSQCRPWWSAKWWPYFHKQWRKIIFLYGRS